MKMLDQSDIDALLTTSLSDGESAAAEQPAGGSQPAMDMPPGFELRAGDAQLDRIMSLEVPAVVRLAERRMDIDSILELTVGSIIEFDKPADADLDLVINNVPVGTGNAVKCGEKFGLRVIKVEPWIQRRIAEGLFR